jgi:hypothetical protein
MSARVSDRDHVIGENTFSGAASVADYFLSADDRRCWPCRMHELADAFAATQPRFQSSDHFPGRAFAAWCRENPSRGAMVNALVRHIAIFEGERMAIARMHEMLCHVLTEECNCLPRGERAP